jgi:hypothetical protein
MLMLMLMVMLMVLEEKSYRFWVLNLRFWIWKGTERNIEYSCSAFVVTVL